MTDRFGTVYVICNNAGIGPMAPVAELTMDDWHWMIGVNLYGVIHGVHTFLPILEANPDGGHIVNTASEVLDAELASTGSKVGVSVLCLGTVRTNIQTSSRNRPPHLAPGGLKDVDISLEDNPVHRWIGPRDAGAVVVRAIKRGDLYALTHPDWYGQVERRHEAIAVADDL